MDAAPYLEQIAKLFNELNLDAVMIGNAAASIQGSPAITFGEPPDAHRISLSW